MIKNLLQKLKDPIKSKKITYLLSSIFLAATYILSSAGKVSGLESFIEEMKQYPYYFDFMPKLIIFVEVILGIALIFLIKSKFIAKVSITFLALLTLAYSHGYFFLNIEKCGCFGEFDLLNSDHFHFTILKNIALLTLSYFILVTSEPVKGYKQYFKNIGATILSLVFIISFIYKFQIEKNKEFQLQYIGKAVNELNFSFPEEIKTYEKWFLFLPTCSHCKKAIPEINRLIREENIKVIGITIDNQKENLSELKKNRELLFNSVFINEKTLKSFVKKVPTIFTIENDTISKVENP